MTAGWREQKRVSVPSTLGGFFEITPLKILQLSISGCRSAR